MMPRTEKLERATGELFGDLWGPYDDRLFEESVQLFFQRLERARLAPDWFKGRRCLDAGCGGGRNSIAMARLGAAEVVGIDLGEKGLQDATGRASALPSVRFQRASILDIPFPDESFDLVWCAGVLMITADENRALDELTRVTKVGGRLYLLVYATEGLRWPLVQLLRPLAAAIGRPAFEQAIRDSAEPANKRRTFLDDLYCPRLDFYDWDRLERMIAARGFQRIERWGSECRLDHESSLEAYREDLESLLRIFRAGSGDFFEAGSRMIEATTQTIAAFEERVARGELTVVDSMNLAIGQGHHRVLATKG